MGYNIGMRLVEDFFAKSGTQRCANFRETAETIAKVQSASNKPMACQYGNFFTNVLRFLKVVSYD